MRKTTSQKNMQNNNIDIQVYKDKTENAIAQVKSFVITDDASKIEAVELANNVNKLSKAITSKKEDITKPMNEALKNVRSLFKPLEDQCDDMIATLKSKVLAYTKEQIAKEAEIKRKLEARVEKGTMKPETAINKIQNIQAVEKTTNTESGAMKMKTIKKLHIIDKALIPLEFMLVDEVAIKKAIASGQAIAGAELRDEQIMSL